MSACLWQAQESRLKNRKGSIGLSQQGRTTSLLEKVKLEEGLAQFSDLSHELPHPPSSEESQSGPGSSCQKGQCAAKFRASYREGSQCPRVTIQYRILQTLKQQKTLKNKSERDSGWLLGRKIKKTSSNETKNIAKNYGKAIVAFIARNKKLFRSICKQTSTPYQRITQELSEIKSSLTTVMGFRRIWTSYKYATCMRVVSHHFLSKNALAYIFNSKVSNVQTHIKYRNKFLQALRHPANFDHIKDY